MTDPRRAIPSVERVLAAVRDTPRAVGAIEPTPDDVRRVLEGIRGAVASGAPLPELEQIVHAVWSAATERTRPSLQRVINATGVLIQTNLGRAPLSKRAVEAMTNVAVGYSNLEYDLATGQRGKRDDHLSRLIRSTTGAEDGLVVNNTAAALLMVLTVFASGREVIVSRGQAVEIGGGFRIPDVLLQSGATLREVGTTNRTYARDYQNAWTPDTAAILRVHSSNFQVVGFTATPSLSELASISRDAGGILIDDVGSGCLLNTERFGMQHEPTVQESVAAGADLVLFSGDKLLGGPQAGLIVGRAPLIADLKRHPLARALRVDRMTIAGLEATLLAYELGSVNEEVPLWVMLGTPVDRLKRRASRWVRAAGGEAKVVAARSVVGGGSLPGEGVPTWCAALPVPNPDAVSARLRAAPIPIITRVESGSVLLDPRSVSRSDDAYVAAQLRAIDEQ